MTGYPHVPAWAVLGTALLAALGFVNYARFVRAGTSSSWADRYFDEDIPKELRNLPFAQLPGAIMFTMWTVMFVYTWFSGDEIWDAMMGLFLFASFPFGAVAIKRLYRPPDKAKPRWLRDEEQRRSPRRPG